MTSTTWAVFTAEAKRRLSEHLDQLEVLYNKRDDGMSLDVWKHQYQMEAVGLVARIETAYWYLEGLGFSVLREDLSYSKFRA